MTASRNKWSYDGYRYPSMSIMGINNYRLELFDINCGLVTMLAIKLWSGRLTEIKSLFQELTNKQKRGLLNITILYDQIPGFFFGYNTRIVLGQPIEIAQQLKHKEIEVFFDIQQKKLEELNTAFIAGAAIGTLSLKEKGATLPSDVSKQLSLFFKIKDAAVLVQTAKAAYNAAQEEQIKKMQ